MHKWGASVFIILMFLHMGRVFLFGAYKYPRELNWIVGVLLLASGMAEGFTGYLLPWDQTAYWASVVGINLNGTAPFLGPWLAQFLRSGQEISGETLTRFYSLHMLVLPGAIAGLIGLHLYLVVRLGVTSPPWSKEAAGRERPEEPSDLRQGLTRRPRARRAGRIGLMAEKPSRFDLRRADFARYKKDVKERGKPFFPWAMFEDTVMSLVVVTVIVALAAIWKWTSYGPHHDGLHQGLLGPEFTAPADPGTINFVPRPDWYFYFLFYLLRIFKWPESVFLGTIGVPTVLLVLLIALPFYRHAPRAAAVAAAGRGRRRDSRRRLDGGADVEGRDGEGGARLRGARRRADLGQGGEAPAGGGARREALRHLGLHGLPHVSRQRLVEPRRPGSLRDRQAEPRHRLPDPAPEMPVLRQSRLADAEVRRRSATQRLRQLAIFLEASKGKQ